MENRKQVSYQELEDIYVLCMRQAISSTCEKAWGGTNEGAFGTFKKHDKENTRSINAAIDERKKQAEKDLEKENNDNNQKNNKAKKINPDNYKHIVDITSKSKSFSKFDFQACNNTIAHLEPVYRKIFADLGLNKDQSDRCISTAKELSGLRNKLAHLDPSEPSSKIIEYQNKCISNISQMLDLGFGELENEDGVKYIDVFRKKYIQYMDQSLQCWYKLSDVLDITKYDFSRFLEVCATNNIESDKTDGKYRFRTSNLEETLEILKNHLAINGDNVAATTVNPPATPQSQPQSQPQPVTPEKQKKKNAFIYIIVAIICAIIIGGIILISTLTKFINSTIETPSDDTPAIQDTIDRTSTTESISNDSVVTEGSVTESGLTNSESDLTNSENVINPEKNQILPEHENDVRALQYSDDLALRNQTITVKVGSFATPPPALVWDNIKIYSQNTDVAIGEDSLVKGVAPGTTYIIVESTLGMTSVYRVIVE